MKILNLECKNFCCFKEFSLRFSELGLVWVTGENKDTKSATNNGCGKTTIFKSLTFGLFNKTIDGSKGDKLIRSGCNEAVVKVKIEKNNTVWDIIRKRNNATFDIELLKDGEKITGDKVFIQEKINQLVGLDFASFKNTVLYGQNDFSKFANPRTRDSERKEILNSILKTDIFGLCHDYVKDKRDKIKVEIVELEKEIKVLKARIEEQNLKQLKDEKEKFELERELKIQYCLDKIKKGDDTIELLEKEKSKLKIKKKNKKAIEKISHKIIELEKNYNEIDSFENEIKKIEIEKRVKWFKLKELESTCISDKNKRDELLNKISKLRQEKCPICNSKTDSKSILVYKDRLIKLEQKFSKRIIKNENIVDELNKEVYYFGNKIDDINSHLGRLYKFPNEINRLKEELHWFENEEKNIKNKKDLISEKIKQYVGFKEEEKNKIEEIKNIENPYRKLFKKAKANINSYKKEKTILKKKRKNKTNELAHIEFWIKGFSNKGLPSYIMDHAMPILTDRTNYYLKTLSDNDIKVMFSTQKKLKTSKGYQETINMNWDIEGVKDFPPSGGQLKKIEIATDLALMDLVSSKLSDKINILVLDEILDGLDEEGCQRVLILLQKLRKRKDSIFVISHESNMKEIFEKSIMVTKENGISSLEVR